MKQYHLNNIPDELMKEIRIKAATLDMTIREFILQAVEKKLGETSPISPE